MRLVLQSAFGAVLLAIGAALPRPGFPTLASALELAGPLLIAFALYDVVSKRWNA